MRRLTSSKMDFMRPHPKFTKPNLRKLARAFIAGGYKPFRRAVLIAILKGDGGGAKNISALKPWAYARVGYAIQIEAATLGTPLTWTQTARR